MFDTNTGDDNDLNDLPAALGGPFAVTAPYHIARVLTAPGAVGTATFMAYDTQGAGNPTTFQFDFPNVPSDYNDNGVVDAADYVLWRNGGPLQNDATPGVQPADYDVWKVNFGRPGGSASGADLSTLSTSASNIPEPAGIVMAFCAVLGVAIAHRRVARVNPSFLATKPSSR